MREKNGSIAEKSVWDAVKANFKERSCIAYWNYPIFSEDYISRKEPDILILDKELGVIILEVKGLKIDNIVSINGHKWSYRDFYDSEGNPYQQAENQMFSLFDWIKRKSDFSDRVSRRIMVALPYITKDEWASRGFDQLPSVPPILFKEDLEIPHEMMKKIKSTSYSEVPNKMTEEEWHQFKEVFTGKVVAEEYIEGNKPKYSYLYIASNEERLEKDVHYMKKLLQKGMKVIVFTCFSLKKELFEPSFFKKYKDAFLFQYHENLGSYSLDEPLTVIDGIGVDEGFNYKWFNLFPSFNKGQYNIEHAPINEHLAISAGAGTGKTTVMIQRIMFLLAMDEKVTPKDIVMITFTRKSAQEMKQRLKDELLNRFKITGQSRYLVYAEQLPEMNVSTIHSFAKSLIQELGFVLGFGRNVRLKGYKVKRREIIEEVLNTYAENDFLEKGLSEFKHFELVRLVEKYWDEMERKGLTQDEIEKLEWGQGNDEKDNKLNEAFKYIFANCEERFNNVKQSENAITLGDLVRKISQISSEKPDTLKELSYRISYLFVDEFQDSDDVQITLAAKISEMLKAKLFVVGDIKQSIYRFRGADYTAFEQLKKQVSPFHEVPLNINYRTASSLLNKVDAYFKVWGEEGTLTYEEDDRLQSFKISTYGEKEFNIISYSQWKDGEHVDLLIKEIKKSQQLIRQQTPKPKKQKIALLVRTNKQAKKFMIGVRRLTSSRK